MQVAAKKWETTKYFKHILKFLRVGSEMTPAGTSRVNKISAVRLYNIDTESDKPTRQHPHPLPALIQIQAIHDEIYSTVIVIEVQHLLHSSTLLFRSIQELCRTIFSSTNKIMAWGEVKKELLSFEKFNLFDISQITNTFNLQKSFAY